MALSGYVIAKHIQPSNVLSFYKLKEVYLKIDEQELLRALASTTRQRHLKCLRNSCEARQRVSNAVDRH